MADNFEISVNLDDDMMVDDESTTRLKSNASKRKGRGFQTDKDGKEDFRNGGFDTVDSDGSGKAQRSVEGWIVLVTNIHEEATEDDVMERFGEYGEIKNLNLNLDRRTGFVKGYALIEYAHYNEAKAMVEAANGSELLGQIIQADFAFVRGTGDSRSVQVMGTARREGRENRDDRGRNADERRK